MSNKLVQYGQDELIPFEDSPAWRRAYVVWLAGKRQNTRKAYGRIVADFFQFANVAPADVTGDMVNAWKLHLQSCGRRDTTVAQRLAGLSSFFNHLVKTGLVGSNPVHMVERRDLDDSPYGNARPMTMADFTAIWEAIDGTTPTGAMYRALFIGYALTGKRRSELLRLHGRDIDIDGDAVWYRVAMKGGKTERRRMPTVVWQAIRHYLTVAGRTIPPGEDEPVFVATHTTAGYIDGTGRYIARAAGEALSGSAAAEAMKRAAIRAGVNPDRVTIHGMRHLSARLWKQAHGNDIRGLQLFLGHANVATTQVYDDAMNSDEATDYDAMAAALFGTAAQTR